MIIRPACGRLQAERGSVPIALLAAIIAAGLITAITGSAMMSQRSMRFDREFTEVLHIAEGGVQHGLFALRAGQVPAGGGSGSAAMNGGTYSWTATPIPVGWQLSSTGDLHGVDRTVELEILRGASYFPGVFADTFFDNNDPGNHYRSYNSTTGAVNTGGGVIGSNGTFKFSDQASLDQMQLYGPTAKCEGGSDCPPASKRVSYADPYDLEGIAPIDDYKAECDARGYTTLTVSSNTTLGPHASGLHCYSGITVNAGRTLLINGTAENPVVVYLSGRVRLNENSRVCISGAANCTVPTSSNYKNPPVTPGAPLPVAAGFQVLSASTSTVFETMDPYNVFHGVLHAPRADCYAQKDGLRYYGAVTCRRVYMDQYAHFWIDQAIGDASSNFAVGSWAEE
jgi:hypothetical protein